MFKEITYTYEINGKKIEEKLVYGIQFGNNFYEIKNVEDLFKLQKTKDYQEFLKNFVKLLLQKKELNFTFSELFKEIGKEKLLKIKLKDTFVPFYHFVIEDILTFIEETAGKELLKQRKNYQEIKKFCKDFEWLKNFYIQIELLDLTPQQQEQTKRNLILFNKYYKNVLKNAIKLCKLPQNK